MEPISEPMNDAGTPNNPSPPGGNPKRRKMQIASDSEDSKDEPDVALVVDANVKKK